MTGSSALDTGVPEGARRRVAELLAVRHGESTANVAFAAAEAAGLRDAGVIGRDADVPLSPRGREQAMALGRWLATLPASRLPEVVVCSPYLRARQTWELAEAAAGDGVQLPAILVDVRLRDRVMGDLELLTAAAVADRFPEEAARMLAVGQFAYRPPAGESFGDVAARLAALLEDLHRDHGDRRVLLVAHDAVVLMLRHLLEGLAFDALADVTAVANASVTRWRHDDGRLVLAEYNATDHL